uniref:CCHC-type domain-containing protein n=1 Tax=Tanacetum cinerariifolium TaxID=118510 RepID=A0A6L2L518_TANCI|nr:hypothetical protein [Tanacetum cinerariifolium]
MIPEPGDAARAVPVPETFHVQTDDELTEAEIKQIEADDQAIQTIILGLPEDIYAAVDICETAQEIWLRVQQMMKEWSRHVTIFHQTKDLHTTDYTYLYDFLKYNEKEHGLRGNAIGNNDNQIRCYNCRGLGHLARNCTLRSRRRDVAYLQTQLLIAQKEEVGIQIQAEEFDLMVTAANLDEIEDVNANCISMANLQQALTSGTQTDKAHEEPYNELLEPIPEPHQVLQNDRFVISEASSVEQGGGTVEQHPATVEETHTYLESVFHNLAAEVDKVNSKMALGYQNPFYLNQAQQKQQSLYNGKVLLGKHDPPAVYDLEETLKLAQESRLKMKQLNKEIKPVNYIKINHLSEVFVSQMAKSREELYLSNASKTANVSKSISIPNEEFSDDTTPSVARKFLIEVKSTIVTLQHDESLAKHKALEWEIERLLRAVVSQDIMSVVQNNYVVDTSNLQTELERTKERFKNCIIKKENKYAKLWNDWYKKCEECKYDKISYDKAYNDMQQKIKRLQAQLGDQKGKSKDTSCVSNNLDPLPQKLENENVEFELQVRNYEKENAHLKTAYKNQFDSINVTRAQTKLIIDFLLNKLHDTIYENAKLRAQLFDKVSKQKDTTKVTSNSVPTTKESKVVENDKVIAPEMFRINPFKNSRKVKNLKLLINFVWKFLGTVRFGNDHVAAIMGFDDLQ